MCIFTQTKKGIMKTKAETIPFEKAVFVANKLVDTKKETIGLFIMVGINTGLRGGDILRLTWEDLLSDSFVITEKKTGKVRTIQVNSQLQEYVKRVQYTNYGLVFTSQKKSVYTIQQVNRLLKELFEESKFQNVSTHSLRKTFGRRVYEKNKRSEHSLILLSDVFGHSNIQITRTYLGLKAEEIASVYMNLY
jgi:integrase